MVYYASKSVNNAQMNDTTTKNELLTVVVGLDKFYSYTLGTHVFAYYSAFKYLLAKMDFDYA